jgi:hypothetical protein
MEAAYRGITMKDNIEDRLRYKGTQLVGVMPDLGNSIDNVCLTYTLFHNSNDRTQRAKLLRELHVAADECQKNCKTVIEFLGGNLFEGALPNVNKELSKRVRERAGDDLYGAYNTLTLLGKNLVGIHTGVRAIQPIVLTDQQKAYERIQLLFQMHIVCADITELSLITDPNPPKLIITH